MQTAAIVLEEPRRIALRTLDLTMPGPADLVVDVDLSGISTGTERLLYDGSMPSFPGMGYPLVPGYEAVGRVIQAGAETTFASGQHVFVPGANCYREARGLFGASASRLVVPAARVANVSEDLADDAVLLALAATAYHTISSSGASSPSGRWPELIIGHGTLGRLLARIVIASGAPAPLVWETNPNRRSGAIDYDVIDPADDTRRDYASITDVSGDAGVLNSLIDRLRPGGEICLAGFYKVPLSFAFAPAFMREARLRIAAQWQRSDLDHVAALAESGALSLKGLVTHRAAASRAADAYATAFADPDCLKMILDWSDMR